MSVEERMRDRGSDDGEWNRSGVETSADIPGSGRDGVSAEKKVIYREDERLVTKDEDTCGGYLDGVP